MGDFLFRGRLYIVILTARPIRALPMHVQLVSEFDKGPVAIIAASLDRN